MRYTRVLHLAHSYDPIFFFLFHYALSFTQNVLLGLVQFSKCVQPIAHIQSSICLFFALGEAPAAHAWPSSMLLILCFVSDRVMTFVVAARRNQLLRRMDVSVGNLVVQLILDELLYHLFILRGLESYRLIDRITLEV